MEKAKLSCWFLLLCRWKLSALRDQFKLWKCSSQNRQSKRLCMKHSCVWGFTVTLMAPNVESCPWFFYKYAKRFCKWMHFFSVLDNNFLQAVINHVFTFRSSMSVLSNILDRITTQLWFLLKYKFNYPSLLCTFCQYNFLEAMIKSGVYLCNWIWSRC